MNLMINLVKNLMKKNCLLINLKIIRMILKIFQKMIMMKQKNLSQKRVKILKIILILLKRTPLNLSNHLKN